MGRPELPVDHTVPERGELAAALRELRADAGLTYDELASRTGLSAATLKRAASGRTVPSWSTFTAFTDACCNVDGAVMSQLRRELGELTSLWRSARVAERGRLKHLRRPASPELVTTAGHLSEALEYFYEGAGAVSLRRLQALAGGAHLLPVSTAARIVSRQALPASRQQCVAFLSACGLGPRLVRRWADAYERLTTRRMGASWAVRDVEAALAAYIDETSRHSEHAPGWTAPALRPSDLLRGPGRTVRLRGRKDLIELFAESRREHAHPVAEGVRTRHPRAA